jgi:hypothetical protein
MLSELLGRIFAPSQVGLRGMKVLAPSNSAEKVTSNNLESDRLTASIRTGEKYGTDGSAYPGHISIKEAPAA